MFQVPDQHRPLHNFLMVRNKQLADAVRLATSRHNTPRQIESMISAIGTLSRELHGQNRRVGWWTDPTTGLDIERNFAEVLMLKVSEVAEGYTGLLGDLMDDKLPERKMLEVELADVAIRIYDTIGGFKLDYDECLRGIGADAWDREMRKWRSLLMSSPADQLMNIILPLADSMEGARKGRDRTSGILQALLRTYVVGMARSLDVCGAVADKAVFNIDRADHQLANRKLAGGKAF